MPKYLVLRFEDWIAREQAAGLLQMNGYESVRDLTVNAVNKIPKELWLSHKKDSGFLKSIRERIAVEIGMCLLEGGRISFERQEDDWAVEFRGSVNVIDTKDGDPDA